MSDEACKLGAELALLREIDRLKAENYDLLSDALRKANVEIARLKARNAALSAALNQAKARMARRDAMSDIRKAGEQHDSDSGARHKRPFELDVTHYYDPVKLDPNGYELATLAHELMAGPEEDEELAESYLR